MARCAVSGSFPPTPFVTPVLPGPGSDIRMKMAWKVHEKTRNSGVWFFRDVEGLLGCGVWPVLIGVVDWVRKGSYHTSVGDFRWFPLHLFVCIRAVPSCRATYWRPVLATASRCVEGYRTPYEASSCYLGHCDILVMDGQCQDEFLHCTESWSGTGTDQCYVPLDQAAYYFMPSSSWSGMLPANVCAGFVCSCYWEWGS